MRFCWSHFKKWLMTAWVKKYHVEDPTRHQLIERFSHELRTSLTGIVGYSEFVESTSTEPMVNFTAKIIRESGQGLTRTSNSFFELHRLTEGKMRVKPSLFSVGKLVRDVVQEHQKLAIERAVSLFFTCADDVYFLEMKSDEQRVRQVVDALVFAAVLQAGKEQSVQVEVLFDENKNYVQFIFNVSAVGIDQAQINLSKKFWSDASYAFRLQEGPGVELALAKALIHYMKGYAVYDVRWSDNLIQLVVNFPIHDGSSKVVAV